MRIAWLPALLATVLPVGAVIAGDAPGPRSGAQNYVLRCMGCHGADGEGVPHRIPALRAGFTRFMASTEGREYLLRIPGASNSALSDAELAEVMNYLAARFAGDDVPADLAPFTADEVTAKRRPALTAVAEARHALILRLAARGAPAPPDDY